MTPLCFSMARSTRPACWHCTACIFGVITSEVFLDSTLARTLWNNPCDIRAHASLAIGINSVSSGSGANTSQSKNWASFSSVKKTANVWDTPYLVCRGTAMATIGNALNFLAPAFFCCLKKLNITVYLSHLLKTGKENLLDFSPFRTVAITLFWRRQVVKFQLSSERLFCTLTVLETHSSPKLGEKTFYFRFIGQPKCKHDHWYLLCLAIKTRAKSRHNASQRQISQGVFPKHICKHECPPIELSAKSGKEWWTAASAWTLNVCCMRWSVTVGLWSPSYLS